MSLRQRFLTMLSVLFVLLGAGLLVVCEAVLLPGVEAIERANRGADLKRAHHAVDAELSRIGQFAEDWARWDDTYAFLRHNDEAYRTTNLTETSLDTLDVDFVVVSRTDGPVVGSVIRESMSPLAGLPVLGPDCPVGESGGPGHAVAETPLGALLLSGQPVLRSDGSGPALGVLCAGRLLDESLVARFAEQEGLPITLDVIAMDGALGAPAVDFPSARESDARVLLPVRGATARALQLRIVQPRPFYGQMLESIRILVLIATLLGLLALLVIYALIDRILVRPILSLRDQSEQFGASQQIESFPPSTRTDELGDLARSFRAMALRVDAGRRTLEAERGRLAEESVTDPLTLLGNRRALERALGGEEHWVSDAVRLIATVDLDHFKDVNDRHGHDVGDKVLRQMAQVLRECSRTQDLLVRTGGEEFTLVCRVPDASSAATIVERIRSRTEQRFFGSASAPVRASCSIGFVVVPPGSVPEPWRRWPELMKIADLALYEAKEAGRNRWVGYWPSSADEPSLPQSGDALGAGVAAGRWERRATA